MSRPTCLFFLVCLLVLQYCVGGYAQHAAPGSAFTDSLERALPAARDTERVRLLLQLARAHNAEAAVYRALPFAQQALESSSALGWAEGRIRAHWAIGACYSSATDFEEAVRQYRRAAAEARTHRRPDLELPALIEIAQAYSDADVTDSNLHYKFRALALARALRNTGSEAGILTTLGGAYFNLGRHDEAIRYWKSAINLLRREGEGARLAMGYNNLAEVHIAVGRLDLARRYLDSALRIVVTTTDRRTEAYVRATLSGLLRRQGQKAAADAEGVRALGLASGTGDNRLAALLLGSLAEAAEGHGDYRAALGYRKTLDSLNRIVAAAEDRMGNLRRLMQYTLAIQRADYEKEAANFRRTQQWKTTGLLIALGALGVAGGLALVLYRILRRNRTQNRIISLQSAALAESKDRIEKALLHKEMLLQEIHHRVKNNLQIISSLLDLQSYGVTDATAREALQKSQGRVFSMALIHQKLYQTDALDTVDFSAFANDLFRHISAAASTSAEPVQFKMQGQGMHVDIDLAVPLGLALNELITNSLKHGFDAAHPSPAIAVELAANEGNYVLRYSDNGRGLPPGMGLYGHKSLGLRLITRLGRQLGGTAAYIYSGGSRFTLCFPMNRAAKKKEIEREGILAQAGA